MQPVDKSQCLVAVTGFEVRSPHQGRSSSVNVFRQLAGFSSRQSHHSRLTYGTNLGQWQAKADALRAVAAN